METVERPEKHSSSMTPLSEIVPGWGASVGGAVGGWLFGALGVTIMDGIVGDLIEGVIGAVVILFVAGLFKK